MKYTTTEIMRGIGCLSILKVPGITKIAHMTLKASNKLRPLELFTYAILRKTAFAHFCGGENLNDVKHYLKKMESQNICGILDYAAEAPITGGGSVDYAASVRRTIESIKFASGSLKYPFLATKMTGFMTVERLFEASEMILIGREVFRLFSQGTGDLWHNYGGTFDFITSDQSPLNYDNYKKSMTIMNEQPISQDRWEEIAKLIKEPDVNDELSSYELDVPIKIEFYEWEAALFRLLKSGSPREEPIWEILRPFHDRRLKLNNEIQGIGNFCIATGNKRLTEVLNNLKQCAASAVSDFKPFLLMDAEMNSIQPAVDLMTNHHIRTINRNDSILFGNTYQMYLKESTNKLRHDYRVAKAKTIPLGLKIVRGAYITHEKKESTERGRPYPIHNTISETHKAYDEAIKMVMPLCATGEMRSVFGTHNEESIKKITDVACKLKEEGQFLKPGDVICTQLLGMSDASTSELTKFTDCGVIAGKYIPYGPLRLVLPYLIRRLEENHDTLQRVQHDIHYLMSLL